MTVPFQSRASSLHDQLDTLSTRLLVEGPGCIHENEFKALAVAARESGLVELADEVERCLLNGIDSGTMLAHLRTLLEADESSRAGEEKLPTSGAKVVLAEDAELLNDFVVESREHLSSIEHELLALEQDPRNFEGMHAIFRAFHTIKGMSGFLQLERIQAVAHQVETLLDLARNHKLPVTPATIDIVLQSADFLKAEVVDVEGRIAGRGPSNASDPAVLIESLERDIAAATQSDETGDLPESQATSAPLPSGSTVSPTTRSAKVPDVLLPKKD